MYNLSGHQIQYNILMGWIEAHKMGSYRMDLKKNDLLVHIDGLKRLLATIFYTKSFMKKMFKLSLNQISRVIVDKLIHVMEKKNLHRKYPMILIPVN